MHNLAAPMSHPKKTQVNVRLTKVARDLLAKIADSYGITHGNVLEMLLRAEAARLGILGRHATPPAVRPPIQDS